MFLLAFFVKANGQVYVSDDTTAIRFRINGSYFVRDKGLILGIDSSIGTTQVIIRMADNTQNLSINWRNVSPLPASAFAFIRTLMAIKNNMPNMVSSTVSVSNFPAPTDTSYSAINDTITIYDSSTLILTQNNSRKFVIFQNNSSKEIYITFGATATTLKGVVLDKGDNWVLPKNYTGAVSGIVSSGDAVLTIIKF